MRDLMLHNSSVMGSNMVIICQLLSAKEFTGAVEAFCKLLQRRETLYFQYVVTIQ